MEISAGDKLVERIRGILGAASEVRVAVAFWGHNAVDTLGLAGVSCPMRIVCNLDTGGSNPQEIRRLHDLHGLKVRTNPGLHAKVWWTDKAVILGSSNASANGLGFEGKEVSGWIEANVEMTDQATIDAVGKWFDDKVWSFDSGTRPLGEMDIDNATALWKRRRRERPLAPRTPLLLDELLSNPEAFRDRGDMIAVYVDGKVSTTARKLGEQAQKEHNDGKLEFYEDWRDVTQPGAYVLDFGARQRKHLPNFRGIWRFVAEEPVMLGGDTSIALCRKVENVRGLEVPEEDVPRWIDLINRCDWEEGNWRRSLYEFAGEVRAKK